VHPQSLSTEIRQWLWALHLPPTFSHITPKPHHHHHHHQPPQQWQHFNPDNLTTTSAATHYTNSNPATAANENGMASEWPHTPSTTAPRTHAHLLRPLLCRLIAGAKATELAKSPDHEWNVGPTTYLSVGAIVRFFFVRFVLYIIN